MTTDMNEMIKSQSEQNPNPVNERPKREGRRLPERFKDFVMSK